MDRPLMLIDAHNHLADPRFAATLDDVLARAADRGVHFHIQGGVGPEDWERQEALGRRYPGRIFPCFGLHPWWVAERTEAECRDALSRLGPLLAESVGVGELGADFGKRFPKESHALQLAIFEEQLKLAIAKDLPIVLHVVRAHDEILRVLKRVGLPRRGGIVHAFSGDERAAREYAAIGLLLSLGGPVARPKGFEAVKKAVVTLRPDQIAIESDSPDQPPPGFDGRLNEPSSIWEVAEAVAALQGRKWTAEQVLRASRENLVRVFELKLESA